MAYIFGPNTWEAGRCLCEFEASLVCTVSSRTARAGYENFISKIQSKKRKKKEKWNCLWFSTAKLSLIKFISH